MVSLVFLDMSYSGAPTTPNKQWLYIADPYQDDLINDPVKIQSLLCYTYSQGYTGLVMYEMSNYVSGGVLTQTTAWSNFIQTFNAKGIDVAAAFGGPNTANAIINYSAANPGSKFKAIVTEIEWWNYSWGLPFQDPTSGAYSFIDFVYIMQQLKPVAVGAGVEIYMYCGFAQEIGDDYNSGFDLIAVNTSTHPTDPNKFTINGDFTTGGILNGEMYKVGQKILVADYPVAGPTTEYTITDVDLYLGNTRIEVTPPLTTAYNSTLGSKILNKFNIVAADDILQTVSIPGNKTGLFSLSSSDNRGAFARIISSTGNDGDYSVQQTFVTYDFLNDVTVIQLAGPGVISNPAAGGYITMDISGNDAGSLGSFAGDIITGNELSQLYKLVDEYWLHVYVATPPGIPRYSRAQARSIYIAADAAAWDAALPGDITPGKNVEFIVSSELDYDNSVSRLFFEGKDSTGAIVYQPKNPIDAYKYIVTLIPGASPPQSANYAKAETDPNVNAWLDINGIVIFKDTDIRPYITGNGPQILIDFGGAAAIVTSTGGTYPVAGTYCDDCLPFNPTGGYVINWVLLSKPVGSSGYVVPTSSTGSCSGSFTTMIHYDIPGQYVVYPTVSDGPGSGMIQAGGQTFTLTISAPSSFDINSITFITGFVLCSDGPLDLQVVTNYNNPTGSWSYSIYDPSNNLFNSGTTTLIGTTLYVSGISWTAGNGAYSIHVTNDIGETAIGNFTLALPTEITATFVATGGDCFGNNGTAVVTPSGGVQPYTYQWDGNPVLNTDTLIAAAGSHYVDVTDSNLCTKQFLVSIPGPAVWDVQYTSADAGCFGTSTGSIVITSVTGGYGGPYTYSWSHNPALNSPIADTLPAGTYTVTITDFDGCSYTTAPIGIGNKYAPISFSITGPTTVCNYGKDPYTFNVISVSGSPVKFEWSNGDIGTVGLYSFDTFALGPNIIFCTMTDVYGCTYTASYNITVSTWNHIPNITVTGTPLTSCTGSQAVITVTNVVGTGYWAIAGTPTTPSITIDKAWWDANYPQLPQLNFNWVETDPTTTCVVVGTVTLDRPTEITLELDYVGPNPCGGPGNVGSIDVSVINGCPPYTYSWTSTVPGWVDPGTQDISGLQNGDYTVTVTDSNAPTPNSTSLGPITVATSFPTVTAQVSSAGCGLANTGAINVSVNGGTAPYTYLWNDGATTQDRSNLTPGLYTVVVTDDNGCTAQATYTIFSNASVVVNINGTAPTGVGANNGTATALASGGFPPYTYLWSNGETTQTITGLDYGTYTVLVTSSGNCTNFASITWTNPIVSHPPVDPCVIDRLKCCAASIAYQYVKQRKNGLWDKAACTMNNLMLILGYIDDMCNYMEDGCLSVDEIQNIAEKANQICGCCGCSQNPYDDTL